MWHIYLPFLARTRRADRRGARTPGSRPRKREPAHAARADACAPLLALARATVQTQWWSAHIHTHDTPHRHSRPQPACHRTATTQQHSADRGRDAQRTPAPPHPSVVHGVVVVVPAAIRTHARTRTLPPYYRLPLAVPTPIPHILRAVAPTEPPPVPRPPGPTVGRASSSATASGLAPSALPPPPPPAAARPPPPHRWRSIVLGFCR